MALGADSCRCVDLIEDLAWAGEMVGQPVAAHRHLVGGMSSIVVRCEFDKPAEQAPLVLRVLTDRSLLQREPDIVDREAEALRVLRSSNLGTPDVVAAHYSPDVGRLLMTWCDGRVVIRRAPLAKRVDDMATLAAAIAATPLPPEHTLPPWWSWVDGHRHPPHWGDTVLWRDAIDLHRSQAAPTPPNGDVVLLHRDFHPLNVLWTDDPVGDKGVGGASVVDWVNACVGHPHAELGHCRWNLTVTVGPEAARRFLDQYRRATAARGYGDYDRWWDIDSLLDKLPGPIGVSGWHSVGRNDLSEPAVAAATDAFLREIMNDVS